MAAVCRNAITCFRCGKLGHISRNYRQITHLPRTSPSTILSSPPVLPPPPILSSLSSSSVSMAPSRVLCFLENDLFSHLEAEAGRGVILIANERV